MQKNTRLVFLPIAVLLIFSASAFASQIKNTMHKNASPYLAMHSKDPVAWQQWSAETLALAKQQNKLLFVSVGYFSCHWCHVMQRESFSDAEIAKKLNRDFIPVKVDRELNAALDAHLIEFVERTRGFAGWPLNVFVSPEGYPVLGLVYLPKADFSKLIDQVQGLWKDNQTYLLSMSRDAAAQIKSEKLVSRNKLQADIGKQLQAAFVQQVMGIADDMSGGFGDQSKFPMTNQLRFLIDSYQKKPTESLKNFLQLSLNQMATQGLRDHLGGGFFRYTVDPTWQTPHFEKMLYDNASLAIVFLRAGVVFDRKDYLAIAYETLDFMRRELLTPKGAMIASLSAIDGQGEEGGYYLWEADVVKRILDAKEYNVVNQLWKLQDKPAFGAGYLPRQAMLPDDVAQKLNVPVADVLSKTASAQAKLLKQRKSRNLPADNKQLASWNGLALSAFVYAAQLVDGKKYQKVAHQIRNYLVNTLWDKKQLSRASVNQRAVGSAGLEDYAFAAQGLLDWARLVNSDADFKLASQWVDIAWQRFYKSSGWQLTDQLLLPFDFGEAVLRDEALPSASAILIRTALEIARQSNNEKLYKQAASALELGVPEIQEGPFYFPSQIELIADFQSGKFNIR